MSAIPPLAGLCSYEQSARAGGSVDATVGLVRRLARSEHRTLLVLAAHLNAVPEWEVKCAFALHLVAGRRARRLAAGARSSRR